MLNLVDVFMEYWTKVGSYGADEQRQTEIELFAFVLTIILNETRRSLERHALTNVHFITWLEQNRHLWDGGDKSIPVRDHIEALKRQPDVQLPMRKNPGELMYVPRPKFPSPIFGFRYDTTFVATSMPLFALPLPEWFPVIGPFGPIGLFPFPPPPWKLPTPEEMFQPSFSVWSPVSRH